MKVDKPMIGILLRIIALGASADGLSLNRAPGNDDILASDRAVLLS